FFRPFLSIFLVGATLKDGRIEFPTFDHTADLIQHHPMYLPLGLLPTLQTGEFPVDGLVLSYLRWVKSFYYHHVPHFRYHELDRPVDDVDSFRMVWLL